MSHPPATNPSMRQHCTSRMPEWLRNSIFARTACSYLFESILKVTMCEIVSPIWVVEWIFNSITRRGHLHNRMICHNDDDDEVGGVGGGHSVRPRCHHCLNKRYDELKCDPLLFTVIVLSVFFSVRLRNSPSVVWNLHKPAQCKTIRRASCAGRLASGH